MSAVVSAVSHEASKVFHEIAKASEGWDPIGHMVASTDSRNANLVGNYLDKKVSPLDPVGTAAFKPIGGVMEQAGDEIRDWGSWVPETIHDAGTAVDDGLRDIGVNPDTVKMAIASTALTLTGQAWAIPLLNAAMVKAKGGSWEDMALAAATSYVASAAGAYVGDYVSSAVTDGVAITPGQVASQLSISAGSQQAAQIAAANAAALGAGTTFTATALSNMASAGVSNATAQLIRTGSIDINKVLQSSATAGISSGVSTLTRQIPGFSSLPAAAQKTINAQITSSLQGKDVNVDALGMSLASDMALAAVKDFYKNGFSSVESAYNTAAEKFNSLSEAARPALQAAQDAWNALNPLQTQVEDKVDYINGLVDKANATKDSSMLATINAEKASLDQLVAQRDALIPAYKDALAEYDKVSPDMEAALASALERRADVFTYLAKQADPEFDPAAFMFLNPEAAKSMYQAGAYGTGMSAAEAFLVNQANNPDTVQKTSWREGFATAGSPTEFDATVAAYQKATGQTITPDMANTNLATYAAYQTGLANSTQSLMSLATEAEKKGDTSAYSQYMGKAFQQAASDNLGWVQQDANGNYIWGDKLYDSSGALVGDYSATPTGEAPAKTETQLNAEALYGAIAPDQVAAAQGAAEVEGVKKALTGLGYTATTQAEAEQLAGAGDTYKEITDPLAAYAKEHTVSLQDAADYLKQFNYQGFAQAAAPYIGQGAQYTQAAMQRDALQKAMQSAMQQGTQFSPTSYRSSGSGVAAGAAGLTGLAGLAALMGTSAGGTAPETPQAQIQQRPVNMFSDTPAEAAGKVGVTQLLQGETDLSPHSAQAPEQQQPREFGDIQPTSEDDNMDNFRAGGVIPNANFGYADQVEALAGGGIASLRKPSQLGDYSDGGQLLRGPGTGLSDNIPATIDRNQPARLASGEFVVPADVVSALGGGSTEAGAKLLYEMLARIRHQAHGSKQQIKPVDPSKVLPK